MAGLVTIAVMASGVTRRTGTVVTEADLTTGLEDGRG